MEAVRLSFFCLEEKCLSVKVVCVRDTNTLIEGYKTQDDVG